MVKSHRKRHNSASSDGYEDRGEKIKHKKHSRHERRSSSKERYGGQHRHRSRSSSSSPQRSGHSIKHEPGESHHRRRDHGGPSGHRDRGHMNQFDPHKKIKQEPRDERQQQNAERRRNDRRRMDARRQRGTPEMEYGRPEDQEGDDEPQEPKVEPNFELSGKLTEDTNTFKGVVIKYNEPPEARKPNKRWRFYPFKSDEPMKVLHLHRQSAFLLGRDRKVADIPVDHPSCSKQHAVFQYRLVPYKKEDGKTGRRIAPYIIDLESANGTFVNNKKIDPQRYYELFEKDVVKFGFSSREYVLLHDKSNTDEVEDDDAVD